MVTKLDENMLDTIFKEIVIQLTQCTEDYEGDPNPLLVQINKEATEGSLTPQRRYENYLFLAALGVFNMINMRNDKLMR